LWAAQSGTISIVTTTGNGMDAGTARQAVGNSLGLAEVSMGSSNLAGTSSSPAVLFLPQRALAAPGASLREQLTYPSAAAEWACRGSGAFQTLQQTAKACCRQAAQWKVRDQQQLQQQPHEHEELLLSSAAACHQANEFRRQQQRWLLFRRFGLWYSNWLSCGLLQERQQQQLLRCCDTQADTTGLQSGDWIRSSSGSCSASLAKPAVVGHCLCCSCHHLLEVVQQVGLAHLLSSLPQGLDTTCEDWLAVLSPGEIQRLAIARVLLHR
jgi:hypothetical protein